ncbi:Asp23/Gls24 family envelope stress response protein [Amnibacterium flavum]|uniref:Asp23/Gls24 family protein n=1 Tax=Amnibacterium flavum TaxID=2173173 RepID=A0A2V1HZT9_9MICO|nr:Asp23/Gls24 family envelope stress response protein [Amnibacterium flavum]PVZ96394.1 hypothetical protein DDQ50_05950 [Amnibacterium flavum]
MTSDEPIRDPDALALEPDDLDGHTIDELSDYLDRDMTPPDPSIDGSAGCQIALDALERLREVSRAVLLADQAAPVPPDESWVTRVLLGIAVDARAGRDVPLTSTEPGAELAITEGAIRGLIRAAGDTVGGLLIGRVRLDGDVLVPGAPVRVTVDASVGWGQRIPDVVSRIRDAIHTQLLRHTELNVVAIDVNVHDIHVPEGFVRGVER